MSKSLGQIMNDNSKIPMKCKHCNYTWDYSGSAKRATCPSCGNKTNVEENRLDK